MTPFPGDLMILRPGHHATYRHLEVMAGLETRYSRVLGNYRAIEVRPCDNPWAGSEWVSLSWLEENYTREDPYQNEES